MLTRDLVPHPLAGGGEVEVLAGDGEVVDEGDAAAGGMALVGPVAGFEQRGAEEADLDDLAADAVDLNPVADADAVLAHEDEPAEEGEDEVLEDDRETRRSEAENRRGLAGCAEDEEKHEAEGDDLDAEDDDGAQGMQAAPVHVRTIEEIADGGGEQDADENEGGDPGERLKGEMAHDGVLQLHLREPLGVDGGELFLGLELILDDVVYLGEGVGLAHASHFGFGHVGSGARRRVERRSNRRPIRRQWPAFRTCRVWR